MQKISSYNTESNKINFLSPYFFYFPLQLIHFLTASTVNQLAYDYCSVIPYAHGILPKLTQ